jgi:hypothetical protein
MGVDGQRHILTALPPGKTRCPLYRSLGGPQGRYGRVRIISLSPEFDPRNVQLVASRYTDNAILAHPLLLRRESNWEKMHSECLGQYLRSLSKSV